MRQSQLRVRPRVRRVLQLLRERDLGAIRQAGHEGLDILTLKSVRPAPRDCQASEAIRAVPSRFPRSSAASPTTPLPACTPSAPSNRL
jgi:hypothetical protein